MAVIRNLEWLDHNSERAYPLAAEATHRDLTDTFELPRDFLVALKLSVHAGENIESGKFTIKSVGVYSSGYSVVVGYDNGSDILPVATALISKIAHTENMSYRLGGVGNFIDSSGYVVIGSLDSIEEQPAGEFHFDLEGGRLESDVVYPNIRGVSSIQVENGSDLSSKFYGDIIIQAGRNMRVTPVLSPGEDPIIILDAIDGEGLNEECVCDGEELAPAIRRLNGIPPTTGGDFTLLGSDCAQWSAIEHGLRLDNPCSEPCCGCVELVTITQALEQFGRQATTLENFITSLEARVTQMDQVVLGSRLGDRGCSTCD